MKKPIALCGATIAVIAPAGALAAGGTPSGGGSKSAVGTTVTVRIEGANKTLLEPTMVKTHTGSIIKGGTPKGKCPDTSAAGALDVATHGKWTGKYDKSLGLEITSVFGEKHTFSSPMFWEIFVNNKPAQSGACLLKLHKGDQLLYAAASTKGVEDLIAIKAPKTATVNKPFNIKVLVLNAKGKGTPLSGAKVSIGHKSVTTKANGTVSVKSANAGKVVLHATHKGDIRAAPATVTVTG
ncbi:MAG TPA: hypothetical protein VGI87_01855 [Solirubrobacteraceae bacterium]